MSVLATFEGAAAWAERLNLPVEDVVPISHPFNPNSKRSIYMYFIDNVPSYCVGEANGEKAPGVRKK